MAVNHLSSSIDDQLRLQALFDLEILDTPPEPEFDDIVQLACRLCDTPVALVSLVAEDRQWFKARVGFDACETPIGQSVCRHALLENELLVIPDLALDLRTRDNPLVTAPPGIRFYAGAVLKGAEGTPIGTLCVIDGKPRPAGLNPAQLDSLRALGRLVTTLMIQRRATLERDKALIDMRAAGLQSLDRALEAEATSVRLGAVEARTRAAQEAGRVGAFEFDITTERCVVTPEFCRIFGLPSTVEVDLSVIENAAVAEDRRHLSTAESRRDGTASSTVEYRIRRLDDGGIRWIARRSSWDFDGEGRPVRWLGIVQDVSDRKQTEARGAALVRLGDALRDAESSAEIVSAASRLLGEALEVARVGYATIDQGAGMLTVQCGFRAPDATEIAERYPSHAFAQTLASLEDGMPLTLANVPAAAWLGADVPGYASIGTRALIKIPLISRQKLVGLFFVHSVTPRTWSTGEIEFVQSIADRTYTALARIKAEEHQRFLNQELSHRLKNTLAMVQAIAGQTLRTVTDKVAVRAFEERIIALSNAHDVLLQQSWAAASSHAIARSVFGAQGCLDRVTITGPDLKFGPKATLSLSLLLHELSTNAIKYGALCAEAGRVTLDWSSQVEGGTVTLEWTERGGPPVKAPQRKGFGSRLISMGIGGSGGTEMDYRETGLVARFRAPIATVTEI